MRFVQIERTAVTATAVDIACLAAFVTIGRDEHDSAGGAVGFLTTFAPFAIGWLVAAAATGLVRHPLRPGRAALTAVAAVAVALGIRIVVQDHAFVLSFTLVATTFVMLFTVGWRLVLVALTRWRVARPA